MAMRMTVTPRQHYLPTMLQGSDGKSDYIVNAHSLFLDESFAVLDSNQITIESRNRGQSFPDFRLSGE
jgi:hypothetical protein